MGMQEKKVILNHVFFFNCKTDGILYCICYQLDSDTVKELLDKVFKNYRSWCAYLHRESNLKYIFFLFVSFWYNAEGNGESLLWKISFQHLCIMYLWCRFPNNVDKQQLQILYIGLYFLIWGEASNIRFMPECLCYIFHNVGNIDLCW